MTARFSPTRRQADLLRFVAGYQQAHGFTPSYDEIARGVGVASKCNINRMVYGLEERGFLRTVPQRRRAIEILVDVALPRAPDGAPLYFVAVQ